MPVPLREVVFRNTNNIEVTLTVEAPIGSVVGAPQTVAPMSNVTVRPGVTDCLSVRLTASDPTHGLSGPEARARLDKYGNNELEAKKPVPRWKKFLAQFQNILVVPTSPRFQ